jgi:WD40 repeat protein
VLTASEDKAARLWDAASDKFAASFVHQDTVEDAAFSANGARILTASTDHTVNLWDAASGKLIASFAHLGWPFHAAFSPDGARVLTASTELPEGGTRRSPIQGTMSWTGYPYSKLWDTGSGALIASFEHLGELQYSVRMAPES